MSTDSLASTPAFDVFDQAPQKPPTQLFYVTALSISIGFALGLFGILRHVGLSSSQEYFIGGVGYLLTALLPIVMLQITRAKHDAAKANYIEKPYDFYGGDILQRKMLKSVAAGLLCAALPIWIFFSPLAEKFV